MVKRRGRQPKAAAANGNGHGDALTGALVSAIDEELVTLKTRMNKLEYVKAAIAEL